MTVIVGSYPVSAPSTTLTPCLDALADLPAVTGFEVQWRRDRTASELAEIQDRAPGRRVVVTDIGWTMASARFAVGLASSDENGRQRAVQEARALASMTRQVAASTPEFVRAVELHSAPAGGTALALNRSLSELTDEDWGGAEVFLEHVDAPQRSHAPSKGFLGLDDEITIAREAGVGLVVNWARSAIETRSADGPVDHIERARKAGVLRAVIFSGVAPSSTIYGPAWGDAHLPFAEDEPASILTAEAAHRAIAAAGAEMLFGVKMSYAGSTQGAERMLRKAVETVANAVASTKIRGVADAPASCT